VGSSYVSPARCLRVSAMDERGDSASIMAITAGLTGETARYKAKT